MYSHMIKIPEFPHFSLKFHAYPILLVLIVLGIILNLLHTPIFGETREKILKRQIMQMPKVSMVHEKLAQFYLGINYIEAEKEFYIAEELYTPEANFDAENILGNQSSPWQTWINLNSTQQNLENEIQYWESVNRANPGYQYANLKLAVLHFQLGNKDKTREYLESVLKNSPANEEALKLKNKI